MFHYCSVHDGQITKGTIAEVWEGTDIYAVDVEFIVDGKTVIPRGLFKGRDLIPINKPFETGETTK